MGWIDLRSDTVTRPDAGMYAAMTSAPLGDDVFGDDPTARRLEETAAGILGKEAALFVTSGTMGNSIAIALGARPGDEAIVEASAHSVLFEVGGAARLWGVQAHPIAGSGGVIPLDAIRAAVRPSDIHVPRSRMLILEQTSNLAGGKVLPLEYLIQAGALASEQGLHFHLDGARIFNAAIASGARAEDIAAPADTVMFCLSKGLGAPAGSILAGPAGLIQEARRIRKLLGGGLRQAGVLAACGLYALEHNVDRLAEDHANAAGLAQTLRQAGIPGVEVEPPDTNMVYVRIRGASSDRYRRVVEGLRARGVLAIAVLGKALRFVFHKDVPAAAAAEARAAIAEVLAAEGASAHGPA